MVTGPAPPPRRHCSCPRRPRPRRHRRPRRGPWIVPGAARSRAVVSVRRRRSEIICGGATVQTAGLDVALGIALPLWGLQGSQVRVPVGVRLQSCYVSGWRSAFSFRSSQRKTETYRKPRARSRRSSSNAIERGHRLELLQYATAPDSEP